MILPRSKEWAQTPAKEARGYIKPHQLSELWFHTGTRCNLACDFCLEGASPSDNRLQAPRFEEVKTFIDEALQLNVEKFSFTGGEPFLIKDFIKIIDYASQYKPCLILTNGTLSPLKRLKSLSGLDNSQRYPISFRVSIDYPCPKKHNEGRGEGTFEQAITGLKKLYQSGYKVSVARHIDPHENKLDIDNAYGQLFRLNGLPDDLNIVAFPDFLLPGAIPEVPHITQACMTQYQTAEQRRNYMCANSKMVIKKNGKMQVYACTLVDDDDDYFLGNTLRQSMQEVVNMKHHRCYSCFALGASCSET